jgi:exodeoxyribonuclease III
MRLLTWNILHGGGATRMPEIALALLRHAPDVIVLTEYRTTTGGQIRGILADHGWPFQCCSNPAPRTNGILLASRFPLREIGPSGCPVPERFARAVVTPPKGSPVDVVGVHIPDDSRQRERLLFWSHLVRFARNEREGVVAILGDFNTGRHREDEEGATFSCTERLGELVSLGYADAWRVTHPGVREFTWYSPDARAAPGRDAGRISQSLSRSRAAQTDTGSTGRGAVEPFSCGAGITGAKKTRQRIASGGFRLDAVWVSRVLRERIASAEHSHAERDAKLSDHSMVLTTLLDDDGCLAC